MSEFVDIEAVKRAVDIVSVAERYTQLKKNRGTCPMCGEKGCFVATHRNAEGQLINLFHCFKCKEGGNVVQLVMLLEKVEVREAALKLMSWYPAAVPPAEGSQKKYMELMDDFLTELLVLQPGETQAQYLDRVKKAIKSKLYESYLHGKGKK